MIHELIISHRHLPAYWTNKDKLNTKEYRDKAKDIQDSLSAYSRFHEISLKFCCFQSSCQIASPSRIQFRSRSRYHHHPLKGAYKSEVYPSNKWYLSTLPLQNVANRKSNTAARHPALLLHILCIYLFPFCWIKVGTWPQNNRFAEASSSTLCISFFYPALGLCLGAWS